MIETPTSPILAGNRASMLIRLVIAGLILALLIPGPAVQAATADVVDVVISRGGAGPRVLHIDPHTTVRWRNRDRGPRRIVSTNGVFDSAPIEGLSADPRGGVFAWTFDEAGQYPYWIGGRRGQRGVILVRDPDFDWPARARPTAVARSGVSGPSIDPGAYIGQGNRYDCPDFESQLDAQAVLRADPSDPNHLDPDRDGLACDRNRGPFDRRLLPRIAR